MFAHAVCPYIPGKVCVRVGLYPLHTPGYNDSIPVASTSDIVQTFTLKVPRFQTAKNKASMTLFIICVTPIFLIHTTCVTAWVLRCKDTILCLIVQGNARKSLVVYCCLFIIHALIRAVCLYFCIRSCVQPGCEPYALMIYRRLVLVK